MSYNNRVVYEAIPSFNSSIFYMIIIHSIDLQVVRFLHVSLVISYTIDYLYLPFEEPCVRTKNDIE